MTDPRTPRRRLNLPSVGFAILAGLVLVAIGATAAWLWVRPATPDDLAQPTASTSSPLEAQDFVDSRTVTLAVDKGGERGITANTAGTLTGYECTPGQSWSSGTSPAAVNSTPLLAFHTDTPLWRDLNYGDKGADVIAIQTELARLGYDVTVDGWFGWVTWDAYRQALENVGASAQPRTLTLASLLWLPSIDTPVSGCPLEVGDTVEAGTHLAERSGELSAVAVTNLPTDLIEGDRKLTFGGVTAPLDENGHVTDADALAALADTSGIRSYDPDGDSDLTATIQLTEPITVYSVPVGAVSVPGAAPSVTSNGARYPVAIVASSLGRSLVTFETEPPATIDTTPDPEAS